MDRGWVFDSVSLGMYVLILCSASVLSRGFGISYSDALVWVLSDLDSHMDGGGSFDS